MMFGIKNVILPVVAGVVLGACLLCTPSCETILPGLTEARTVAQDAKDAADRALALAEQSGDPAALELAKAAEAKAENAVLVATEVEAQAAEWAKKVESGEINASEGGEIGGLLGGIIGGERGKVIGTLAGAVLGGWYYRRIAKKIVAGIDAAKRDVPELHSAFRIDGVRDAISGAVDPLTWGFIERNRQ